MLVYLVGSTGLMVFEPYAPTKEYRVCLFDRTFLVREEQPEAFERLKRERDELHSVWYLPLARGFYDWHNGTVYVRAGAYDMRALIGHELGHALGHVHTWRPTTMNPYGSFRLHDWEGLTDYATACP